MKQNIFRSYLQSGLLPLEIDGVALLAELALDMRWSWNHSADELWQKLDPALWELTRNPWVVLQTISHVQLERQLADPVFRQLMKEHRHIAQSNRDIVKWFPSKYPASSLSCVAYFSMEYMLSEALPIYVGGLGNVAGDQLKSANDLGVPVTAIGLLYQQGYFRQDIDRHGSQQEYFPYNDPGSLPVTPLRLSNGEWLRIRIMLPGYPVWVRTWQVQVGDIMLYLLDSNDPANLPIHRGITSAIYGGSAELRLKQEMILGIGGWQVLRALDLNPEVCHLNEGHCAFVVLERANDFMKQNGVSFETALTVTSAGNLFTSHTTVEAGFDRFPPSLMKHYFNDYVSYELKIEFDHFMSLGRLDVNNKCEEFNMAVLAFRGCSAANAVSKLHCEMSKKLFSSVFPRWPLAEIPVGYVTNGVHMPSWDSKIADGLWTQACGKDRWKGELLNTETQISDLPDDQLWNLRIESRKLLVRFVRQRVELQTYMVGVETEFAGATQAPLHPDRLTLGFARRFVPYKRTNLLLTDPQRFIRILKNERYPVQLVLAGKAPPFDDSCKLLIRQWNEFIQQYQLYGHVVFLADYDMHVAGNLVQGVDVWINTPRRPREASGTSGMKILVNGGINLSVLDGWWAEAYTPEVGWSIGNTNIFNSEQEQDTSDALELYSLLENEVIPEFYTRDKDNIPARWVARMRKSMSRLTPAFSANRTVREYTEKYYLPAAKEFTRRASDEELQHKKLPGTISRLKEKWHTINFGDAKCQCADNFYFFETIVYVDQSVTGLISVEIYADGLPGQEPEKYVMKLRSYTDDMHIYESSFPSHRPVTDYTMRIIPHYGVNIPMEDAHIIWQH